MTDFDQKGQTVDYQLNADQINIGITFAQYKADLAEKEKEIRSLLVSVGISDKEKIDLELKLNEVHKHRLCEQESYQVHITDLKERIARLDMLVGKLPDNIIEEAKQALSKGDTKKAELLFIQVEKQANPHIAAAAEAAYQRGKLAEDDINYKKAFEHYHRAMQLNPDNTFYLSKAGNVSLTLGFFNQALKYYELALASGLNTYGEAHPDVAAYRNNLGLAWDSLGEYKKAIEYLELALASDLNTYGEAHPRVATHRNNLGLAWYSLGEYKKAIEYYELALTACINCLGNAHPTTKTIADNLTNAKNKVLWECINK